MLSHSPARTSEPAAVAPRHRIAFVVSGFDVGGAELQLLSYLRLAPKDFRVSVIALEQHAGGQSLAGEFERLQVDCYTVPRNRDGSREFLSQLTETLRRLRPEIVHSFQDGSPGTWGRMAAWLAGVPVIVHSDRCPQPQVTTLQRLARPWLDRATKRFFSNADYTAKWIRAKAGVKRQPVSVIPNGVDLARFDPARTRSARPCWGIPAGAAVAGFLGKLRTRDKRLDVLFDALTQMPETTRPDYLVLGGDGPDAALVDRMVRGSAWLEQHTRLLGMVNDVPAFLEGIDYLVLSSDYEGMPNVVLEAMAMCKPVVATAVSDIPELIDGAGFLAKPGDAADLARALVRMQALSRQDRQRLGRAGRARVERQYDLERIAARFWDAHRELCTGASD
jgi:glycosyltransferase involved in cell wall biosynthesis